jgi:4-amino-4-deoxy-L-arabinose transferase-like glycosyltransferase
MTLDKLAASRWAWLLPALAALALLWVNPVGFVGGGHDDARYLDAARCWAANGAMCVPGDHWAARWPVVAPLAAALALAGDTRAGVGLGALPWWIAALVLAGWLGRLWLSRGAGLVAAVVLASVPAASVLALRPNADLPELAAQLAALGLGTLAVRRGSIGLAIAAGAAAGLAFSTRETSAMFCAVAVAAWWLLAPSRRLLLAWAVAGFAALAAIEMAGYWLAAGDPLLRFRLSLAHGAVPSQFLAPGVDTSRSPILNPEFIAGWVRPLGIEAWWPLDPWLNLLPHPDIGPWLVVGILLGTVAARRGRLGEGRILAALGLGALAVAVGLVYGLAVDPRPRMFLAAAAAASLAVGAAATGRARGVALASAAMLLAAGAFGLMRAPSIRPLEDSARTWLAASRGQVETDRQTRDTLALVAEARGVPLAPAGRPLRLTIRLAPCEDALAAAIGEGRVVLEASASLADGSSICLLRYRAR